MNSKTKTKFTNYSTLHACSIVKLLIFLAVLSLRKNTILELLTSYYPNPNPNLIESTKNNSGIKILIVVPHAIRVVSTKTLV